MTSEERFYYLVGMLLVYPSAMAFGISSSKTTMIGTGL